LNWDGRKYLLWGKYLSYLKLENAQMWVLKKTDKAQALLLAKKSQLVFWRSHKFDSLIRIYYYTSFYEKY
jgi:hypothetical protein